MNSSSTRVNKSQRETHSEIERKRRERMKRDTEFLRKQVSSSQCKDKLSIFQAGAERLIRYTEKLGKREYIINDEEYSRIIMENFDGFDIHVRCLDGKILRIHPNVQKILHLPLECIIGKSLHELIEPSAVTKQILNEAFYGSELQWDIFKGLIARNFILALRCGSTVPLHHCVFGADNQLYRFIEFCGDLSHDVDASNAVITFRGLCRPLDPACGAGDLQVSSSSKNLSSTHFTLRLSPDNHQIIEAVGDFESLLGYKVDSFNPKQLREMVVPTYQDSVDRALIEVRTHSPVTTSVELMHMETKQPLLFELKLSAIRVGTCLHYIVCRLSFVGSCLAVKSEPPDNLTSLVSFLHSADEHCSTGSSQSTSLEITNKAHTHTTVVQPGSDNHSRHGAFDETPQRCTSEIHNSRVDVVKPECQVDATLFPPSDAADEWLNNVDTSGFQSLIDDGRNLLSDCILDILPANEPDL